MAEAGSCGGLEAAESRDRAVMWRRGLFTGAHRRAELQVNGLYNADSGDRTHQEGIHPPREQLKKAVLSVDFGQSGFQTGVLHGVLSIERNNVAIIRPLFQVFSYGLALLWR